MRIAWLTLGLWILALPFGYLAIIYGKNVVFALPFLADAFLIGFSGFSPIRFSKIPIKKEKPE